MSTSGWRWPRPALAFMLVAAFGVIVAAPLIGWPRVIRLPAVLAPVAIAWLASVRPWTWPEARWRALGRWSPSAAHVGIGAFFVGLILFWIVVTRFQSGSINAVDFTVYFDRPCYQTLQGRPLFVETADVPSFSQRSQLAVHATWIMLPICGLYAIHATPLWLLLLSVIAVVAGAVHAVRIARRLGMPGVLACAGGLAFVLNDNTARALNYGFHVEVLYAWFIPWMIDAGLARSRASFLLAALACVLVKEDALFFLSGTAVALWLAPGPRMSRGDRLIYLAVPVAAGAANLWLFLEYVVPRLVGESGVTYGAFWANYGPTPSAALVGMVRAPWRVLFDTLTSGFAGSVLLPFLFLPLLGWRWLIGILPVVLVYGASANEQLRAFGIYYAMPLVPFLSIAAMHGAHAVVTRWPSPRAPGVLAAILAGATLLVGSTRAGYSLRPWRAEVAAVGAVIESLPPRATVLVQSSLYPHAGYSGRVQLLTPDALGDPRNADAVILMAQTLGAYPFDDAQRAALVDGARSRQRLSNGLLLLRR